MFALNDLATLRERGHELGCHTFAHCDSSATEPRVFEESVIEKWADIGNAIALTYPFEHSPIPISAPRARTKRTIGKRFLCCRGSGQTYQTRVPPI